MGRGVDKRWLGTEDRTARLRRIENLDPERDYREITQLFYADFGTVMILQAVSGFLMTFAAPRMSRILGATGQLEHHVAKRFVDTALLFRYPLEHGLGPGPGRDAARRVNAMHRRYDIHPDDFVMVGCDVPLTALDFAGRFGWRPVTGIERAALTRYYGEIGRAFGSHRPLPTSVDEMSRYWNRYLDEQLAFEPQNRRLADAVLDHVASMMPVAVRPFLKPLLVAQVDPRIVRACGLRVPSALTKRLSGAAFGRLGRTDPVPDGTPDGLAALASGVYPDGFDLDALGTVSVLHGREADPEDEGGGGE